MLRTHSHRKVTPEGRPVSKFCMTSLDIDLNSMSTVLTPDLLKDLATLNTLVNLSFSPPPPFPRAPLPPHTCWHDLVCQKTPSWIETSHETRHAHRKLTFLVIMVSLSLSPASLSFRLRQMEHRTESGSQNLLHTHKHRFLKSNHI